MNNLFIVICINIAIVNGASNTYVAQPNMKFNVPPPFNFNLVSNITTNITAVNITKILPLINITAPPIYIITCIFSLIGFIFILSMIIITIKRICKCNRKISNNTNL
jgi:hypothetical protein